MSSERSEKKNQANSGYDNDSKKELFDQKQLQFVLSMMGDALCITNSNGRLVYANPAAAQLLEISQQDDIGKRFWEVIPFVERNDEFIQTFLDAFRAAGIYQQKMVDYENINGKILKLRISITHSDLMGGIFILLISDLTELAKVRTAFKRYTSPQIAQYVLSSEKGEQQGGDSREVTILMSDIRGFTALSEKLDAQPLITMLNHYFEKIVEIIAKYKGTVTEFLGDGIFVVFGAPEDDPLHASHAVHCAVEMQNAMADINEWNLHENYPEIEMGIGIHSGIAAVGNLGSARTMKYGCIGKTVNLAGRLEGMTIGGQIIISEAVRDRIDEPLIIDFEESFLPKGSLTEMSALSVSGIGSALLSISQEPGLPCRSDLTPVGIEFHLLKGKTVESARHNGTITGFSENRRFVWLQTEILLEKHQNILLHLGNGIYCKVIDIKDQSYIICLTPKPDNLDELLQTVLNAGQ
ncbi:MAG: PAS domain-containing protein [Lachnospiraceae bacterium]|nr:PAS domain-containing protein [Lachnospiraceae bacterium]